MTFDLKREIDAANAAIGVGGMRWDVPLQTCEIPRSLLRANQPDHDEDEPDEYSGDNHEMSEDERLDDPRRSEARYLRRYR